MVGAIFMTLLAGALPGAAEPQGCTAVALPLPGAAQTMVSGLRPGQTGCLAAGVHAGGITVRQADITLREVPGQDAVVVGQLVIADGADRVTVSGLELDGTNPLGRPSPLVNANQATFTGNDVHSAVDSCFVLGDPSWGVARKTRIAGNLIHDCGVDGTNKDHGVYVRQATDTLIEGNVIRDNPDRGVQLFPNADRTVVRDNLIEANGEGVMFSGDGSGASEDNLVERNIISSSQLRWDVEAFWTTKVGTGNLARGNCIYGGRRGTVQRPTVGFRARNNALTKSRCTLRPPELDVKHG
jgi:hypothetical protein